MSLIPKLPAEIIKLILTKLDCTVDISNCALVCHDWLEIINNNRAIPKSIIIDACSLPVCNLLRRFRNVCYFHFNFDEDFEHIPRNLQDADEVRFEGCIFPNYARVRDILAACGNLKRLEIIRPEVWNEDDWLVIDVPKLTHEIGTLELEFYNENSWRILELIHKSSIAVRNVELTSNGMISPDDIGPLLSLLEENYQDQIYGIDLDSKKVLKKLSKFPRLRLQKLAVHFGMRKHLDEFLKRQPLITHLDLHTNSEAITQCVLANLPLLSTLKVKCLSMDDLDPVIKNVDRFGALTSLEVTLEWDYYSDWLDISIVCQLKKLKKFVCAFKHGPPELIMQWNEEPLVEMREFRMFSVSSNEFDMVIEEDAMWSIMNQMPNLEKLTVLSDKSEPCTFGTMNALRKLVISETILDNDASIQSMKLPSLRYMVLSVSEYETTKLEKYFPQIAKNCPMLSLISVDTANFHRTASGGFEKCTEELVRLSRDIYN